MRDTQRVAEVLKKADIRRSSRPTPTSLNRIRSMAKRTITKVYSDLSGKEIEDGDGGTIRFGVDGASYEVDLTADEQTALREALAEYLAVARKVARSVPGASRPTPSGAATPKEIRAWAQENGHDVPLRGRIPAPVLEAYSAAH